MVSPSQRLTDRAICNKDRNPSLPRSSITTQNYRPCSRFSRPGEYARHTIGTYGTILRRSTLASACSLTPFGDLNVADDMQAFRDFLIEGVEQFRHNELQVYVVGFTPLQDSQHHWDTYEADVAIGFCGDRVQKGFPIDITCRLGGHVVTDPVRPDPANRFIECRYIDQVDLPRLIENRLFAPNSYAALFGKPDVERLHARALGLHLPVPQFSQAQRFPQGRRVSIREHQT